MDRFTYIVVIILATGIQGLVGFLAAWPNGGGKVAIFSMLLLPTSYLGSLLVRVF